MSKVIDIRSKTQFEQLISGNTCVVVQAYATWCPPCRAMAPVFDKHADAYSDPETYAFARVDTGAVRDVAHELGVHSIPAFYFFENGDNTDKVIGADVRGLQSTVNTFSQKSKKTPGSDEIRSA